MAALGNVIGGVMPRYLISRGWELDRARKSTMGLMTCLLLVFCVAAPQIGHPALALALVGAMTFCHGGWGNMTLPAEVFPKNSVGTVTGLGGALGSWMGALSQLGIGSVVDAFAYNFRVLVPEDAVYDRSAGMDGRVSIEVIDLRTLAPYDWEAIATSVRKTSRVIVAHEDMLSWGYGAEIAARIGDELFDQLDAPVRRIGAMDTFVAYQPLLEDAILPQPETIFKAIVDLKAY